MKKVYTIRVILAFLSFFSVSFASAQLTGIKNIPGDYATITAAVNDLNASGVGSGGVTFNVAAGTVFTENVPVLNATGLSSADAIVFQKSGVGANPKIIPASAGTVASSTTVGANGDAIFVINGGDFITIDGIDLQTNASFSGNGLYEYGYLLKKASATDASKSVVIKNCSVTLNKAAILSFGICVSNLSGTASVTVTSTGGRSEDIKIFGNTITNSYGGICIRGYLASSPYDLYDQNIEIGVDGANTITNYGGGGTSAYGIYAIYQNNLKVANNTVNGGAGTTTTLYGIFLSTGTNSNVDIYGNTVTITGGATTSTIYAINNAMGGTGTSNLVRMYNNTITNCSYPTATSGAMYLLYQDASAFKAHIYGNTVSNNNHTPSTTGAMYCLYQSGAVVNESKIYNNTVSGNQKSTGTTGSVYYLYNSPASTANGEIYDNVVNANSSTNTTSGTLYGIAQSAGATTNVYRNRVYDITSNSTGGSVYGISVSGGTIKNVYNNFISDLKSPAADATADVIRGISATGTAATTSTNLWHNTVYLNATSSGVNFSSTGVYQTYNATATNGSLTMQNNVIVNVSTPKGSGLSVAFRRSAATDLNNYNVASDKNLFYAGAPSASKLIYYDGLNSDQTLITFQTRVSPREMSSITELPPFINIAATPYNLHINTATPTQLEGNGIPVPEVTEDYDGDPRNPGTPDIGADEFNGTPAVQMTVGSSTTTQLTGSAYQGVLNQAIIRIAINTSGSANPLAAEQFTFNANGTTNIGDLANATVYYTGASSTFNTLLPFGTAVPTAGSYTVNGSQVLSEGVNYFWLAYDIAGAAVPGNVVDAELVSSKINAVNYIPSVTAPAGNKTVVGPMAGNYNIGAGQSSPNFVTLTEAVNDLKLRGVSAGVTFTLVNAASTPYNEANGETFPIVISEIAGVSATSTVTIRPGAGVSPVLSGSVANAIIRLDGADFITIDGSNNATTSRNLTISNSSTSTSSAVIWIQTSAAANSATDNTVKNVIVSGNSATTTLIGIGSGSATISVSSLGTGNINNVFTNNDVRAVQYGIYSQGASASVKNTGTVIQNNLINSASPANVGRAGIFVGFEDGVNISSNVISGMSNASDVAGITLGTLTLTTTSPAGNEVTNAVISKNLIGDVICTGANSAVGIYVAPAASGTTTIDNNVITGVTSGGTSPDIAGGIYLAGGAGITNVYFNSVSMTGTRPGSPSFPSFAFAVAGTTPLVDVQNNIFVNQQVTASAGKSYAYGLAYTSTLGNYTNLISNNNLLYVAGTSGVLAKTGALTNTGGTDFATLAAWNTETGKDAPGVSLSVDPLLNSATDLQPLPGSPVVGAGVAIAGFTTDIEGTVRNATPSIGAYETVADNTPPVITVTPLQNTSSTAARTIIATITDISGIPGAAPGLPVLYWKINAGAYTAVTGSLVSGNNYSFTFGAGVATGDSISYFIAAQDVPGNATVYPLAGAAGVTANPPAAATTPTAPLYYKVITALSGTYTVGTGQTFNNLTAIANYLNNLEAEITGNVVFELTSTYDGTTGETLPINFNQFLTSDPTWTVTIRPAAGVTNRITSGDPGSGTSVSVINFNGGDRFIFDGRPGGTGTANEWTIRNTRTATTIGAVIRFVDDATNNTIRNLNIESQATSTTTGAVYFHTSSGTLGNSNNTITANHIRGISGLTLSNSIYASGSVDAQNSNNTVSANHLYNFSNQGITLTGTGNGTGWVIADNHLYNPITATGSQIGIYLNAANSTNTTVSGNFVGGTTSNAGGSLWTNTGNVVVTGIAIANGKASITGNTVSNISVTGTGTAARARGIYHTSASNGVVISNNTITNLSCTGSVTGVGAGNQVAVGISVWPGSTFYDMTIENNTIQNITAANTTALASYNMAAGVFLTNFSGLFSKNNISQIRNLGTGTTAGQPPLAVGIYSRFMGTGEVSNNFVALGEGETTNTQFAGVMVTGVSASGNTHKYYHNTITIGGTAGGSILSYGFVRGEDSTTTPLQTMDLKNNIFVVERAGYAIANKGPQASSNWTSDHNDLYSSTASMIGLWDNAAADFAGWKAVSANDANSVSVMPVFISATDKHLVADQNCSLDGKGAPLASGTTDYDGDARNATTPDIGADEFNNTYVFTITNPAAVCSPATVDITAAAVTAGTTSGTTLSYWTNNTATAALAAPNAVTTTGTYYIKAEKGNCVIISPVNVTVDPVTVGGTPAANQSVCNGTAPADITLSGNVGSVVKWQRSTTSDFSAAVTDINVTSTTLSGATDIGALTATTYFRAVVKSGSCSEANSAIVTVTVDNASVGGSVSAAQSVCIGNQPADITLTGNTGAVVKWQRSTTNDFSAGVTDIANTSSTLTGVTIGALFQTTYFRAVVQNGSCNEANSSSIAITVTNAADNTVSLAATAGGAQVCANYDVAFSTHYLNNCNLIATVVPSGAAPISGVINACTKIESSVPFAPVTNEPYVARHYNIIPVANAATATSTVTLYFLQSEFDAFNVVKGFYPALPANAADAAGKSNLRVSQFAGSSTVPGTAGGIQIDPVDASIVYNGTRWEVTFNVTGSGSFFIHTGSFVLPVTGLELKGEQAGTINQLGWSTLTEINNKGFEVQRSADGSNFSGLAFVASKATNGNSTAQLNYSFSDTKPFAGNTYYRLKQVDKDGRISFSNIVLLSRKVSDITLTNVYPNPAVRELNVLITSPKAEKVTFIVTDLTGKVVMNMPVQLVVGDNQKQISVQSLAAGTYILKAVCADGCETAVQRFVKQ